MKTVNKKRLSVFFLLLVFCLLVLQFILARYRAASSIEQIAIEARETVIAGTSGFNQSELGSLAAYESIIERPLFTASRSNLPEETAEVEQVEQKLPDLLLIGVVMTPDSKSALLRNKKSNEMLTINAGEKFMGWELNEIDQQKVVLQKESQRVELELESEVQDSQKSKSKSRFRPK